MSTETMQPLNEDQSMESTLQPNQPHMSNESLVLPSKLWLPPVRRDRWSNLSKCMGFIAKHRSNKKHVPLWMRRTLNRLSSSSALTSNQLKHILDGYADMYKILIYVISFGDNVPITDSDICCYGGNSKKIVQEQRHRNVAFMLYHRRESVFAPLYVIANADGRQQTCFQTDDGRIFDEIGCLMRSFNDQISQRSTTELEHSSDNHDATVNAQESDSLDMFLPSPTNKYYDSNNIYSQNSVSDLDVQHEGDTIISEPPEETLADLITQYTNSSFDLAFTTNEISQQPITIVELSHDHLKEMSERSAVETDDHRLTPSNDSQERQLISQNIVRKPKQRKNARTNTNINILNNNSSHAPVHLSETTIQPTLITESQIGTISNAVQECDSLKITRNPKRHRRVRMLSDLAKNDCPLVQAGEEKAQRIYPEIEILDNNADHVRVKVVTENIHPHPLQCVAPENAQVNLEMMKTKAERECLQCHPDSFNSSLECVYLPISQTERRKHRKPIKVHLFNWKSNGPDSKEVIERENLRLCRLEFYLCKRLSIGQFELISQPCYTSVIDQMDGDLTIDSTQIKPKQLCELGGEKIILPLSIKCSKKGFLIQYDEEELQFSKFEVVKKKLLLTSPPQAQGKCELHLVVKRVQYTNDSSQREEYVLYDDYLQYVPHNSFQDICPKYVQSTSK